MPIRIRWRKLAQAAAAAAIITGVIAGASALSSPATSAPDPRNVLQCAPGQMHNTADLLRAPNGEREKRTPEKVVDDVLAFEGHTSLAAAAKRTAYSTSSRRDIAVEVGGKAVAYFTFVDDGYGLELETYTQCSGAERKTRP